MKKTTITTAILLTLVACTQPGQQETTEDTNPKLTHKLDEYFQKLASIQKFNGAVLLEKDGENILHEAYNMQEDKNHTLHVRKEMQFDIHSISKLMGKVCVIDMEKEGRINRDDKIEKYLKDFPDGDRITIRHLVDNSSGYGRELTDEPENLIDIPPAELVELIKKEKRLFDPGTDTTYSNLGYQLLYYIISEQTRQPFVRYAGKTIMSPLGMNDTGAHFHWDRDNHKDPVKNHENDDGEIVMLPNVLPGDKNQTKMYSTLIDLQKFIRHIKKEPYYSQMKKKSGTIGWSGGGDGIMSHASYSTQGDYTLILFSNYDEIPFGDILETVHSIMNDEPYELPQKIERKAITLEKVILEQYIGKYRLTEFNNMEFDIRLEDDRLALYLEGEKETLLQAENDSTFFQYPDDQDYIFFRKSNTDAYELIYKYKGIEFLGKPE